MQFCFHSGYKNNIGGYATLLICLIRELVRQDQPVVLFNYQDGLIAKELGPTVSKIKLLDISTLDWSSVDKHISHDDVFIVVRFEECFRHLFKVNPKFVYYDINDFIGNISSYKFGLSFKSLGKPLIKKLLASRSLVFMDDTGIFNLQNQFSIKVKNPIFLPIPVTTVNGNYYLERKPNPPNTLRMTYIGRSAKWKMMPLKRVLSDIADLRIERKIRFSIVADQITKFQEYINVKDYKQNPNLKIELFENLNPSELDNFLLQRSDIHFAMGTAALDAAKLGIPTILVDYSTREFKKDYTYNWLFNTRNFSLGKNLDKRSSTIGQTISEIISKISIAPGSMDIESQKSFEYVNNYHAAPEIVRKLIEICKNAKFRLKETRSFIPYYFKGHTVAKNIFGKRNKIQ